MGTWTNAIPQPTPPSDLKQASFQGYCTLRDEVDVGDQYPSGEYRLSHSIQAWGGTQTAFARLRFHQHFRRENVRKIQN